MSNRDLDIALREAVINEEVDKVRSLLAEGANVKLPPGLIETPLEKDLLIFSDNYEIVKLLLSHGANVNQKNRYGKTPLHKAAKGQCLKLVRVLLENGANAHLRCIIRYIPLHFAIYNSNMNLDIIKELLYCESDFYTYCHDMLHSFAVVAFSAPLYFKDEVSKRLIIKLAILCCQDGTDSILSAFFSKCVKCKPHDCKEALKFIHDCIQEVELMKIESINDMPVHTFLNKDPETLKPFFEATVLPYLSETFPKYYEVITDKLYRCIDRHEYLNVLSCSVLLIGTSLGKVIAVHGDCLYAIGTFVNNESLSNLTLAIVGDQFSEPLDILNAKI